MFSIALFVSDKGFTCHKCREIVRLTERISELETRIQTLIEDSKNAGASDTVLDATSLVNSVHCSVPAVEPAQQGTWVTIQWKQGDVEQTLDRDTHGGLENTEDLGDTLETHWRHTGDTLETHWRHTGDTLETHWRHTLETHWRHTGDTLETHWRHTGDTLETGPSAARGHIGSAVPSGSPAESPLVVPRVSSAPKLTPPWLLPPATLPWGLVLAGFWGNIWLLLLLASPWLLPPSTPPWTVFVVFYGLFSFVFVLRPPPEPPPSLLWTLTARGRAYPGGGEMLHVMFQSFPCDLVSPFC
ncbi:hypothetical protein DPX16_6691 [Anabarilius grahami]|uniref:Uncharacterized protein n=1 Tax=Anabarilius grahami TaxID=495550 RepID=A0A3N0YPS0_ANAGA|nr:hypothetical protein DPX16_6691 [Anabarilius grahami]